MERSRRSEPERRGVQQLDSVSSSPTRVSGGLWRQLENDRRSTAMCGRYVRKSPSAVYAEMFGVDAIPGIPSYNVAPTQSVAVVRPASDHREAVLMR